MSEHQYEVLAIDPKLIQENPENPRTIFYEEDLAILRSSIHSYGILVPLTVFRKSGSSKYTLLDGQRRWMSALSLKLKTVPVIIVPTPDKKQNILLMFNIHKVSRDWELVPTALKLEVLIRLLPKDIKTKDLAGMTGMTPTRVTHCLRILRFDKKYLDMTLVKDPSRRIRGEFFAQLEEALEKLSNEDYKELGYTRNQIIDIMIEKYHDKQFVNLIKEFRTLRKVLTSSIKKGTDRKYVNRQVREYLSSKPLKDKNGVVKTKAMSVDELYERTAYNVYAEDQVIKSAEKLEQILSKFNIKKAKNKQSVRDALKKLKKVIEEILSD